MTLDQLRMLVSIADTGSVLAAAAALRRTQPTVSVAIRKLEEELDLDLLARDKYRARLTPAGERICQQARIVLQQGNALQALAGHLASGHEPKVRIAIEESFAVAKLLEILKQLERNFPRTEFEMSGEQLYGAIELLTHKQVDLAITPWFGENLELQSFVLMRMRMIPVAAPGFLSGLPRELERSELEGRVQVVVRDSSRNPQKAKFGVLDKGRQWRVNSHQTKKEILLAGMGWGRLQESLVEEELLAGQLVELQIRDFDAIPDVEIRVARRRDEPVGPVAGALWEALRGLADRNL